MLGSLSLTLIILHCSFSYLCNQGYNLAKYKVWTAHSIAEVLYMFAISTSYIFWNLLALRSLIHIPIAVLSGCPHHAHSMTGSVMLNLNFKRKSLIERPHFMMLCLRVFLKVRFGCILYHGPSLFHIISHFFKLWLVCHTDKSIDIKESVKWPLNQVCKQSGMKPGGKETSL